MESNGLTFRAANADDWPTIWPIFKDVVSAGDTYMLAPGIDESEARNAWMLMGQPRSATYCASIDGRIVGTAIVKPNAIGLGDHVANAAWMVSADARGKGIGRRFAEFVLNQAAAAGFDGMQFNAVVSTNVAAIRLWESLGFRIVGTVPRAFRHPTDGVVPIHIMYRGLRTHEIPAR